MAQIFISYKRADTEIVFPLKDQIEAVVGEGTCWIDLDGIESDAVFANVIIKAIKQSEVFLFMYSKTHAAITDVMDDWTIKEITFAQKLKKRIVFVNIDQSPLGDWFELMFGTKQQVDATSPEAFNALLKDLTKWLCVKAESAPVVENHLKLQTRKAWTIDRIVGYAGAAILLCCCLVCFWSGYIKGNHSLAADFYTKPWNSPAVVAPFFKLFIPIWIADILFIGLAMFRSKKWLIGLVVTTPLVMVNVLAHERAIHYMHTADWGLSVSAEQSILIVLYVVFVGVLCWGMNGFKVPKSFS